MSSSTPSASILMDRLVAEAARAGDPRRARTLARLTEACDDILSGGAHAKLKAAKQDPEFFNPNFVRLNSNTVEQYVRFRARMDKGQTEWTGPVAVTIRADKDLKAYVRLREEEAKRPGRPRARSPRIKRLDEIIDAMESVSDQALLRQTLADGRAWKRELDILLAALRNFPEIDIDVLQGRAANSPRHGAGRPHHAEDTRVLRKLLARLHDNNQLSEFGLIHRNGRIKMSFAPESDLVFPEELALLQKLAGAPSED